MAFLKRFKAAPLSGSFFFVSIIGALITLFYWDKLGPGLRWNLAFLIVFGAMFIASLISMRMAPVEAELALDHLMKKSGKK